MLQSCFKDNDLNPGCQVNNLGTLKVKNNMNHPYDVFVNSAYRGTVPSKGERSYDDLTAGTYSVYYEQSSGYILYPTTFNQSVTIVRCRVFTSTLQ
jgi:hypothetical protein